MLANGQGSSSDESAHRRCADEGRVVAGGVGHTAGRIAGWFETLSGTAVRDRCTATAARSVVVVGDAAWRSAGTNGLRFRWALDQLTDPMARQDTSEASFTAWLAYGYPTMTTAPARFGAHSAVAVVGQRPHSPRAPCKSPGRRVHRLHPDVFTVGGSVSLVRLRALGLRSAPSHRCGNQDLARVLGLPRVEGPRSE